LKDSNKELLYPRKQLARALWRTLGRLALPFLTRLQVNGEENFPRYGPLLMVGNHVAVMEVFLMAVVPPWQVEMLGVGDIPPEPAFAPLINSFGYIPIQRGKFDRAALSKALGVLRQNGVVGIFPEGGIWHTGLKEAHTGVAWLSYHAQAPILPVGFGGVQGAVNAIKKLKRPRLQMNIGTLLPPVQLRSECSRKESLELAANEVLSRISELVPESDRQAAESLVGEKFDFKVEVLDNSGFTVGLPDQLQLVYPQALGLFFFRPVLLDVFHRNLRRPVESLLHPGRMQPGAHIAAALREILDYLDKENPYFLTYRFGVQTGGEMLSGLRAFYQIAAWAEETGRLVKFSPEHRYHLIDQPDEIVETDPGQAHIL
jgi:1-acyl-sn-glycerol-3-phosphate acyltransferase